MMCTPGIFEKNAKQLQKLWVEILKLTISFQNRILNGNFDTVVDWKTIAHNINKHITKKFSGWTENYPKKFVADATHFFA